MEKNSLVRSLCWIVAGNFIYALAVALFIMPAGLITGGSTGIALAVSYCTGLTVTQFVYIFNIAMLAVGWIFLGRKFALTTIASTFIYPTALEIWTRLLDGYMLTDDILLCTIFAGLGIGISLGMIIRTGASTGGMDIPPLILQKKMRIPVSVSLYVFDFCILLSQAMFRPAENVLYGIVLVMIYTISLDKVLMLGASRTEIKVISSKPDEICKAINLQLDRGVTLLDGEGGYARDSKKVVLSVISNRELHKAERLIHSIDPESFIIVGHVKEVSGRGFSMAKKYE